MKKKSLLCAKSVQLTKASQQANLFSINSGAVAQMDRALVS